MYKILVQGILILSLQIKSQDYFHSTYSWEKNPVVYKPNEREKKSDLVIVSDKKIIEIAYDSDGQAVVYETNHSIYHVNSAKAIDGVNKGYMPMNRVLEELDLKARCITPDNKIVFFNKSSVKAVDNLEGGGAYKIFAIDAVDAGCDVEILYTNKKQFSSYNYYQLKSRLPIAHYESRIISPKNLVFETKTYNGLTNFKTDTSDKNKNHLIMVQDNIPPKESEKYSAGDANNMTYIYQLAMNTDKKKSKTYTWDVISRDFYSSLFVLEKDEVKAVEKIINKNKIANLSTNQEKIKKLDSYLKTEFEISDTYSELNLNKAIESKKLGNSNAMKIYIGALKLMQIPFELVISSDRNDLRFDPKFASYVFMNEFLIYFPEINKYVSPVNIYSRLGYPAPDLLNNEGLFIKEVGLGEISSSSAKTATLQPTDYKDSYHNFDVKAVLDFDKRTANLQVVESLLGYLSFYVQPVYRYLTKEQKDEINKNYALSGNSDGAKDFEVLNVEESDLFVKPMVIKFNTEQNDFLENAGNKFIFKVGLLIGPQAELYQEGNRKWPGEMSYPHYLSRTLEINIPEGYKVSNLGDLALEKKCMLDDKEVASFKSTYEVKNNKVIVTVYEDYKIMTYPLSIFDSFKAVINAAADFNKKNLIFEKL